MAQDHRKVSVGGGVAPGSDAGWTRRRGEDYVHVRPVRGAYHRAKIPNNSVTFVGAIPTLDVALLALSSGDSMKFF